MSLPCSHKMTQYLDQLNNNYQIFKEETSPLTRLFCTFWTPAWRYQWAAVSCGVHQRLSRTLQYSGKCINRQITAWRHFASTRKLLFLRTRCRLLLLLLLLIFVRLFFPGKKNAGLWYNLAVIVQRSVYKMYTGNCHGTSSLQQEEESFHQQIGLKFKEETSGYGGLEVACWPLVPKFAGSNPAEAVGFFRAKKFSARLPSEGK